MNANTTNALDFQDPGTTSEEPLNVPGFVNELKNYTLAVSPRPNPPLAFAGALAMLAHLTGRSYVDERGSHTNLYLAALAPTAMGKEDPRDTNKKLAAAAGILSSVPDSPASGEGLEDAVVTETPEAKLEIQKLKFNADEISRRLFESDLKCGAALYCRLYEKAMKLALLAAISQNPENPQMTAEAVRWGAAFALHVTRKMLYEAQFNVCEGKFDRLKKRFLGLIAKAGGQIDRSAILKAMKIDSATFSKVVLTLHMCDMIEEESLSRRKTIYTLKTAA